MKKRAFTLIEIMVVVAIMGLACAMGMPAFLQFMHKQGIVKMTSDLEKAFSDARGHAIMHHIKTPIIFYPTEQRFELVFLSENKQNNVYACPDGVSLQMLDIFHMDNMSSASASVFFYPDGTCDEMEIAYKNNAGEYMQATADWATSSLQFKHLN